MAWFWRADGASPSDGQSDLGLDDPFASQSEAESWLTNSYADLAQRGVHAVALYEENRLVYGPMSLDAD